MIVAIVLTAVLYEGSNHSHAATAATEAISTQEALQTAQTQGITTDNHRSNTHNAATQWHHYADSDPSDTIDAFLWGEATASKANTAALRLRDVATTHAIVSAAIGILTALMVWLVGLFVCQRIWPARRR